MMSILPLLIIPILILGFLVQFQQAVGPYWLGVNNDPSYIYLINFLYILDGIPPMFIQHPGTTVQILGALVIKLFNLKAATNVEIVTNVFRHPDFYLYAVHYVFASLYIATLVALGIYVWQKTKDWCLTICVQAPAILFFTVPSGGNSDYALPVISNVSAEPFLLVVGNLFALCLLKLYFAKTVEKTSVILLGLVCGLGIATKVSFLPMLLIPGILIPNMRGRLLFLIACLISTLLWTIPIWPNYPEVFKWLKSVLIHKGFHGGEGIGFDLSFYMRGLRKLISENILLFVTVAAGFVGGFLKLWKNSAASDSASANKFLAALGSVGLLHFLFVAKQPAPHYMVPAIGLLGLLFMFVYLSVNMEKKLKAQITLAALGIFVGIGSARAMYYQKNLYAINHTMYEFSQSIHEKYKDCTICTYYRSSSPVFGLQFGDDNVGHRRYNKILQGVYPHTYFYHYWWRGFHDGNDTVSWEDLKRQNKCVLLYGQRYGDDLKDSLLELEKIESSPTEAVYRVIHSRASEAIQYYIMSKIFENKKDYVSAYGSAMKAKSLGYPRLEADIENLKRLIEASGPSR